MSKYQFTEEQRVALWRTHGHWCPYCPNILSIRDTTIDHVIPEIMLSNPDKFAQVKADLKLEPDFDLNDFPNWLPCHSKCNSKKGDRILKKGFLLCHLESAYNKAEAARKSCSELLRISKGSTVLGTLGIYVQQNILTEFEVVEYLFSIPLTILEAASRLGILMESAGGSERWGQQDDGSTSMIEGAKRRLNPRGPMPLLSSGHPLNEGDIEKFIPVGWSNKPVGIPEVREYATLLRRHFVQALIRDASDVMIIRDVKVEKDEETNELLVPEKHDLLNNILNAAEAGDASASSAMDAAITIIGDRESWNPYSVKRGTREGNQSLLPAALRGALDPLVVWWRDRQPATHDLQCCFSYKCGYMWAMKKDTDLSRCQNRASKGNAFCRKHHWERPATPFLVGPPHVRSSSTP